jgi:hypothetical protein
MMALRVRRETIPKMRELKISWGDESVLGLDIVMPTHRHKSRYGLR